MAKTTTGGRGGVTAREFFSMGLPGCSQSDAHHTTRMAYSTISEIACGKANPRASSLRALEAWSLAQPAAKARGVWISAARTAGFKLN